MTSDRIKDRRKLERSGVLVGVFGIAVIFQNIVRAGLSLMNDLAREHRVLRSTQTTREKVPWTFFNSIKLRGSLPACTVLCRQATAFSMASTREERVWPGPDVSLEP